MTHHPDLASCPAPHGYNRYTYGCRCDECKAAKATYIREKRAANRAAADAHGAGYVAEGISHGIAGYQDYKCRCEVCITARHEADRRQRPAKAARNA